MEFIIDKHIFNYNKLQFTNFSENKVIKDGKHIDINYKVNEILTLSSIILLTPVMNIPFGIKKYNNYSEENEIKYYLDLSFNGMHDRKEIKDFYSLIKNLDNFIIDYLFTNQDKFNLNYKNKKDLQENYISQIRNDNNHNLNLSPTFKIKLSENKKNGLSTQIYYKKKKIKKICENIIKKCNVKCIIKCNGIWINGKKIGVTWKAEKINIISYFNLLGYSFDDNI